MSYSFRVWLGGDHQLHVSDYEGHLPGPVVVSGHEDADSSVVSVTRLDPDGGTVIQASKVVRHSAAKGKEHQ